MKNLKTLLAIAIAIITIIGCKPEAPEQPQPYTASNPSPVFNNANGVLAAVQTLSYQTIAGFETDIKADVATGIFLNTNDTYYDGGLVKVNTHDLTKQTNNSYASVSQNSATVDLDFGSTGNHWEVAGSANVPVIDHTTTRGMPSNVKFSTEIKTVNTANDLTVSIVSAPNTCDSILYLVAGNNKTLTKTVFRSVTSVTFSAADLNGFTGSGVVQVAPYNFEFSQENGKVIYYINEKVISSLVTFE